MDVYVPPECLEPPPAEYRDAVTEPRIVMDVSAEQLRYALGLLDDDPVPDRLRICAVTFWSADESSWVTMFWDKLPVWARSAVELHEDGHTNGWKH